MTRPVHPQQRRLAWVLLGLSFLTFAGSGAELPAGAVHQVEISGEIDLGLVPYLQRAIDTAEDTDARMVLLHIDTPGGRLDAVTQMRDTLLASPVPTVAFVDRTALSAGALIALASEAIFLAPGSSIGAATPVDGTGQPTDEKVISAVRSMFRATAEARGRDPALAAAMVDPQLEIVGTTRPGELVTLTTREAVEIGFADGEAASSSDVLAQLGLPDAHVVVTAPSWAERLVRALTHPMLGSVLFALGVLLILGELFAGGVGLATLAGAGLIATFFWGHLLAGLTGWEHVVLVGVGVALLLVELFVTPGFGVPGVLGLLGVLSGGLLAMTGSWELIPTAQILTTAGTLVLTFIVLGIVSVVVLSFLSRRKPEGSDPTARTGSIPGVSVGGRRRGWLRWFGDGDVLASEGDPSPTGLDDHGQRDRAWLAREGAVGEALSDLRPAGVASFEGERIDVVSEGDYISAGEKVEVIRAERYRRVVRRARQ